MYVDIRVTTIAYILFQCKKTTTFSIKKVWQIHIYLYYLEEIFILIPFAPMICYSIKKDGETNEKLILRYKKAFFQTRTANQLRNSQNHSRKLSYRKIREKAIIREYYRSVAK